MEIKPIYYLIEAVLLIISLIAYLTLILKVRKASTYMREYCKTHGGNKSQVVREFKKVLKML